MEETFKERQERENKRQYQKWLSCGFKGEMEVNEHGWCTNGLGLFKDEKVKKKILFDKPRFVAIVEYMQLPNRKWISGSYCTFPLHGWAHGISIWDKQYETKEEAVTSELNYIEKALDEKDRKPFVLNAIQTCRNEFKVALFEMVFEPMAQFEQVALF